MGDHVYVQNLVGNHPRRWERTGTVVEVRQHHQYVVKLDGSGRPTLRNRQHLRKFTPFQRPNSDRIIESLLPLMKAKDDQTPQNDPPSRITLMPETHAQEEAEAVDSPPPVMDTSSSAGNGSIPHSPQLESPIPTIPTIDETPGPDVSAPTRKVPRALARLQPHNKPGAAEDLPSATGRLRSGRR